jgi:transcription initiation factor TFIIB
MHTLLLETHSQFESECRSQVQIPDYALHSLFQYMAKSFSSTNEQATSKQQKGTIQLENKFETALPNKRSYKRNLRHAFNILNIIKYKLSLPAEVIEKSGGYYQRALDGNIIKGRSIGAFAVASLYVACRELGIPRQLREIANNANVDPLMARKCYRTLIGNLELDLPFIDCDMYLSKIAKDLLINEKTYQRGLEILEMVKENFLSYGKDPNTLAVAVLYVACLKEGEKIIQSRIAAAGNISIVTLRKRAIDVIKVISYVKEDLKR